MQRRVLSIPVLAAVFCVASAGAGWTWNDIAHRLYVNEAIDVLPKPLKNFYEARKTLIADAVSDPTKFGPRAIFEVDRLEPFPFEELPADRTLAVRKYGDDTLSEVGDAPWRIIEAHRALVEAFQNSDYDAVAMRSSEIAFYVGELYAPGNVSRYGDGEPTGQQGLRERFDSRLMEAFGDKLKVNAPDAIFLDRPAEYAVAIPRKSYIWVDNLLYIDYLSRLGVQSYDRFYYEGMWLRSQSLAQELLAGAAQDTASFWYTAWVEARKPDVPK